MRATIQDDVLYLHKEDVPKYKKGGSIVRNNFFWALRSIACRANWNQDWEYSAEVWIALSRMLLFFMTSGYLGLREMQLEFAADAEIPEVFRGVATWYTEDVSDWESEDVESSGKSAGSYRR